MMQQGTEASGRELATPAFPHDAVIANLPASVIVCAHDRKQYLRAAVESVLAQDVDRSRFEVIVVKNFSDPEIDAELDRRGVRHLLCSESPASLKIAAGLRASRGKVVLLLDDDDLFEPTKVRTVLGEFESNPNLGYYHNQVSYIDSAGREIPQGSVEGFGLRTAGRARRTVVTDDEKSRGLARIAFHYPDFNSSSLAVRREVAEAALPYLDQTPGGVDSFFFFAGLISPFSLLLDDKRLTRYRFHSENESLAGAARTDDRRTRMLTAAQRQSRADAVIRTMVLASGNKAALREIDGRILVTRLAVVFRDPNSRRRDAARAVIGAIGLRGTFAVRENVPSMAGAVLFALVPSVARTTYEHHVSIR
jgi:glycosyltransferase involved in cell wall biosynthesis